MSPYPFIQVYTTNLYLSDYEDLSQVREHIELNIESFLQHADMSITKREEVLRDADLHALLLIIKKVTFALKYEIIFMQGYRFNLLRIAQTAQMVQQTQTTLDNILYDPPEPTTTLSVLIIPEKKENQTWKQKMQIIQEHLPVLKERILQTLCVPMREIRTKQGQHQLTKQIKLLAMLTLDL